MSNWQNARASVHGKSKSIWVGADKGWTNMAGAALPRATSCFPLWKSLSIVCAPSSSPVSLSYTAKEKLAEWGRKDGTNIHFEEEQLRGEGRVRVVRKVIHVVDQAQRD